MAYNAKDIAERLVHEHMPGYPQALKCAIYNALKGKEREQELHRFCTVDDEVRQLGFWLCAPEEETVYLVPLDPGADMRPYAAALRANEEMNAWDQRSEDQRSEDYTEVDWVDLQRDEVYQTLEALCITEQLAKCFSVGEDAPDANDLAGLGQWAVLEKARGTAWALTASQLETAMGLATTLVVPNWVRDDWEAAQLQSEALYLGYIEAEADLINAEREVTRVEKEAEGLAPILARAARAKAARVLVDIRKTDSVLWIYSYEEWLARRPDVRASL